MKKILAFILVSLLSTYAFSQKKQFIFMPKLTRYNQTDLLEGKEICLAFKDYRVIPAKSKVECSFEDFTALIKEALELTYRNAEFFVSNSCDTIPSITIMLKSYGASFYAGMWHTETTYAVIINNGDKKVEEDIEQINRFYNIGGSKTAKKTLSKCFNNANVRLIELINEGLGY